MPNNTKTGCCVLLVTMFLLAGCGGAGPQRPAPVIPDERASYRNMPVGSGTLTVALRVTLDPLDNAPEGDHNIHLHAITYDFDGHETDTDLGHYVGTVAHHPASSGELLRAHITHEHGQRTIRLVQRNSYIEVEEVSPDDSHPNATLIERIPVPDGSSVRPSDVPVEQTTPTSP